MRRARDHEKLCEIWGILNVTPDSFSDGGQHFEVAKAIERGVELIDEGADVVDVGGESTRPAGLVYGAGASPVAAAEELRRVLPVIEALRAGSSVRISIDTTKAEVAIAALAAGASIVNDVSGAQYPALVEAAARANAELVVMHNRGSAAVLGTAAHYIDVVEEVRSELLAAAERAQRWGMRAERLWLDPGLGFAKNAEQSCKLLAKIDRLVDTGYRIMVGASRKAWIASLAPAANHANLHPQQRLGGSLAAALHAARAGVEAVRVHDVAATRQSLLVQQVLSRAAR